MSKLTLSFKGNIQKVFPVLKGSMLIGHDPSCTIHIDSLALSAQHARIDTQDQNSVIVDLDSDSGTFVNQERTSNHILKDGDLIRVGKHTLSYQFEEVPDMASVDDAVAVAEPPQVQVDTPPPQQQKMDGQRPGWLQILNGQNLGKTLSLNRSMTNLGKPGVATAVIARRNEGYFLSHLEGEKVPLVDGKPIGEHSLKLNDGDTIQIGNIKMQFYLD